MARAAARASRIVHMIVAGGVTGRRIALLESAKGLAVGAAAIATVTAVIALLEQYLPALGLTSLYLLAVLPVAIGWGFWHAGLVAVVSFLSFAYFFASPVHSFQFADLGTATALSISIATAYLVSELARRARVREREATLRAREAREAQGELGRIADEQGALRRVATLVAQGVPSERVFEAVTEAAGRLLGVERAAMGRYESGGMLTEVTLWSASGRPSARDEADSDSDAGEPGPEYALTRGLRSSVSAPISVEGRRWGVMIAGSTTEHALAVDAEARLAEFTQLIATAIANAEARAEVKASRARIVTAGDEARRRIERDLHDGAQQRLVSLALQVRAAQSAVPPDRAQLAGELGSIAAGLNGALDELRELSRGIHPAILAEGGLEPALRALARRSTLPVELHVRTHGRLPEHVEVGAYYVVSEALANAVKHARGSSVTVDVDADGDALRVRVRDDGIGGADLTRGTGLIGLKDRVEALGGRIALTSPPSAGTSLSVELPLVAGAAPAE
jgi:signal transduction histidine kinase